MLAVSRTAVTINRRSLTTALPRITERRATEKGPGGRQSDAGLKVAVFGAGGFLGRYVCSELGSNGVCAYIANRGDDLELRHLKPMFDLGRTRFVFYSPRDRDSIKNVIADADIVINMIGRYYESKSPYQTKSFPYIGYKTNYSFHDANVKIPQALAEICLEMQVDNFIHVSSAAASPDSTSEWARTKFEGEEAIKKVYPWVTIIRPTQLFGIEDKFLNPIAWMASRYPFVPLIEQGEALTQPVFAPDVAKTISRICDAPEKFEGKRVDCFGASDYSYKELMEFVFDITGQEPRILDLPKPVAKQLASILQYQRNPPLTPDLVEIMTQDYLPAMTAEEYRAQTSLDKVFTMEDFGVEQTPIEKIAFSYLHRYRHGGHFDKVAGYH